MHRRREPKLSEFARRRRREREDAAIQALRDLRFAAGHPTSVRDALAAAFTAPLGSPRVSFPKTSDMGLHSFSGPCSCWHCVHSARPIH